MTAIVKRILVPVDFGPASEVALYDAKRLAARLGASVDLLHVIEIAAADWWSDPFTVDLPKTLDAMREDADFRLGIFLPPAERMEFKAAVEVVVGNPARQIVSYARNHDIDLIVMGTQGRCGFAHTMVGSVAERTIRTAPCPVLTVRALTPPVDAAVAQSDAAGSAP
jgi:nucleotide-binding universal stress UspA family protein